MILGWFSSVQKPPVSAFVSSRWEKVEEFMQSKRESALKQALIEADKILDAVLREKKLKGETMGERLKEARPLFAPQLYHSIWQAHKLRNQLVHEDSEVLSFQIERAVDTFKKALLALKVLS